MYQQVANVFGALGYTSLAIQWGWGVITLGAPLMNSPQVQSLLLPDSESPAVEAASVTVPDPIGVLFMILAVVFAVSVTVYALVAVPRAVARTGQRATHTMAIKIAPRVVHQKKMTKKRQKTIIERLTWSIKLVLIMIPVLALMIPVAASLGLDQSVVIGFGVFCAAATTLWFGLQFITAKIGRVDSSKVW